MSGRYLGGQVQLLGQARGRVHFGENGLALGFPVRAAFEHEARQAAVPNLEQRLLRRGVLQAFQQALESQTGLDRFPVFLAVESHGGAVLQENRFDGGLGTVQVFFGQLQEVVDFCLRLRAPGSIGRLLVEEEREFRAGQCEVAFFWSREELLRD